MNNQEIARAFSGHRFAETFAQLSSDVRWTLVGQSRIDGSDAVQQACRDSAAEMAGVTTSWLRFVSCGSGDVVAVDAIGRYQGSDGVSVVSSCDIYEFTDGKITAITSYAVELSPDDVTAAALTGSVTAES